MTTIAKARLTPARDNLLPVLGYCMEGKTIYIMTPKLLSLHKLLHGEKKQLSDLDKFKIAADLAQTLSLMHSARHPLFHGHVSSHNIFVDRD